MKRFAKISTLALVAVAASFAHADLLDQTPIKPNGTTLRKRPELAGTVIATASTPYSFKGQTGAIYKGVVEQSVLRRKGSGTLDFQVRILNDPTSGNLRYFTITGFEQFRPVDIDYRLDGAGTQATNSVFFHQTGNPSYYEVNFFFDKVLIGPGQETRTHFLGTSATKYTKAGMIKLEVVGGSAIIPSFKPVK